jgi:S-adenosylmethionine hydrolase
VDSDADSEQLSEAERQELLDQLERRRNPRGIAAAAVVTIGITFSLFQLWLAAERTDESAGRSDEGDADENVEVFAWEVDDPASHTFHGRDVFAPAAAAVHDAGVANAGMLDRATPTTGHADLAFPEPEISGRDDGAESEATGEVLAVDGFGNVITNLPGTVLDDRFSEDVTVNGEPTPAERTYAAVGPGERVLTVGSHGSVECAVNQGRGDEAFGLSVGDRVRLVW